MIEKILQWSASRWLGRIVNNAIAALQRRTDVPMLVVRLQRYQANVRRWYFAVDGLISRVLAKCDDGHISEQEILELKDDGMLFVADITDKN